MKRGRKAAGVEPTQERLTPLTGFEARAHHRVCMPSSAAGRRVARLGEKQSPYSSAGPVQGDWILPVPCALLRRTREQMKMRPKEARPI